MENIKPRIVVSKCLGFAKCRYNGQTIPDNFVNSLKEYVEYVTLCPEVEIGLGVPREPIRLIKENGRIELYQPATESLFTDEMNEYSKNILDNIGDIDGFILKGRSPSCGIKDVKVHNGRGRAPVLEKDMGIFAAHVKNRFAHLPIEEEGRLTNLKIREHFLTKLYTMMKFKEIEKSKSMKDLVKFHSNNKYLLMAYNQNQLRVLGKIVANHEKNKIDQVIENYKDHLRLALEEVPKYTSYINSLMHMFGYFSKYLTSGEKEFILANLEKYRDDKVHLSVPVNLLRSYVLRFNDEYLLDQTIFNPFPDELLDISDTGK